MAGDPKAKAITIPYEGGAFTTTRELVKYIFGEKFVNNQTAKTVDRTRAQHNRTRVIGGPSILVKAANYKFTKFPVARGLSRSGGEPILLLVDADVFTARLHGSHQAFVKFIKGQSWSTQKTFSIRTEKGSTYGPFKTLLDTFVGENP
jgi:hypothetical protein